MRRSSPKADRAKPERPAHWRGAQSIRNRVAIAKEPPCAPTGPREKWSARSAADMEGILYDLQSAPGKLQSAIAMRPVGKETMSGAHAALFLLLAINLFNYIDRQILAALEPDIRASFFASGDVNAMTKTGLLGDAFFVTYMISAPVLGLLADRFSRWIIVGSAVILWSLASGASGLAA